MPVGCGVRVYSLALLVLTQRTDRRGRQPDSLFEVYQTHSAQPVPFMIPNASSCRFTTAKQTPTNCWLPSQTRSSVRGAKGLLTAPCCVPHGSIIEYNLGITSWDARWLQAPYAGAFGYITAWMQVLPKPGTMEQWLRQRRHRPLSCIEVQTIQHTDNRPRSK